MTDAIEFEPATGQAAVLLDTMKELARNLLEVIELEKSGERDGDGFWHGTDVVSHAPEMARRIAILFEKYSQFRWRSSDALPIIDAYSVSDDSDPIPF
jgi:hypothetical protein